MNAPTLRFLSNVLLVITFALAVALLVSAVSRPPDPEAAAVAEFGRDLEELRQTILRMRDE